MSFTLSWMESSTTKLNQIQTMFWLMKMPRIIRPLFWHFFVVGIMVTLINIELFIATAIRQRNIACKDSEITVPLQLSPFMTWLEDVPQIVICLIVAIKIEAFLSEEVQLAKAIFTIAKSILYLAYFRLTKGEERSYWLLYTEILGNGLLLLCGVVLLGRLGRF